MSEESLEISFALKRTLTPSLLVCHKNFTPGFKVSRQLNISYSSPSYLSKSANNLSQVSSFPPCFLLLEFSHNFNKENLEWS